MTEPRSATPLRPSACPGLLRIVPARDGGICRIKLAGGRIDAAQARVVAQVAEREASGTIEVTNRANLQIRGIHGAHEAVIEPLLGAGLGPRQSAGDDVRNLMLSPTAGLDPHRLFDARPLAARILATLESTPRLHDLSPKFALSLDAGEGLAMLEHHHDLWLSALALDGDVWLAFGLAGCPAHDRPLAAVALEHGHALVLALLELFLQRARPAQTRMRHLLQALSMEELLDALAERLGVTLRRDPAITGWRRAPTKPDAHLGIYPQALPDRCAVGGAAPLGRLDAGMLERLAGLAEQLGDGTLLMTPWQSVLLPNVARSQADQALSAMMRIGLLTDPHQPLARLIACTGSAGCVKGRADTKADARRLALLLPDGDPGVAVHLSGCERSCAAAHATPFTLLATEEGYYDLYARGASDTGFGTLRARHLTLDAAGALLRAGSRSSTDD